MKKDLYPGLRKELENTFGRKIISYRDCVQLVEDIVQKTGFTVNVNTLRRFFGLVKTDFKASSSTLTILSKYCGFNAIDEIESIESKNLLPDDTVSQQEVFYYLISLFKQLPLAEAHIPIAGIIIEQTIIFLERNPGLIDRFQREIAKLPAGQYYYYEIAVNMDQLNKYYGNGLQYYVRSKNTEEASVFVNSIQVLRCWLSNDTAGLEKHYQLIKNYKITKATPKQIAARWLTAQLYYCNYRNKLFDDAIAEIIKYYSDISDRARDNHYYYPYFELILCEAFTLTNQQVEAAEFMQLARHFLPGQGNDMLIGVPFNIWQELSSSYVVNNSLNDPTEVQPKTLLNPARFNKKTGTLLSLLLNKKKRAKIASILTKETGFTKFTYLLK